MSERNFSEMDWTELLSVLIGYFPHQLDSEQKYGGFKFK